jgi:hypothetical protein
LGQKCGTASPLKILNKIIVAVGRKKDCPTLIDLKAYAYERNEFKLPSKKQISTENDKT